MAFSIRKSKVDGHMDINFTSTENIIQKRISFFAFKSFNFKQTIVAEFNILICSCVDQFCKGNNSLSNFLMVSTRVVLEYLNHNFFIVVCITESVGVDYQ